MSPLRGILFKLGSILVFIAMAGIIKHTADEVPGGQAVFFRSLFAVPVILVWLWWTHELRVGLKVADPMSHVWRGAIGTAGMACGFSALGMLPLPEVTAIGYAAPLLTVVFAAMFLGENVRAFRLGMVALGMVGVLIVLSPRLTTLDPDQVTARESLGATLVLMSAVCTALAQVFIRKMVAYERTSAIVFWFSASATVLSLLSLPFGWVVPAPRTAALLVLAGLLGGVGQILLTSSYRHADASLIAPFEYASMIFALLIGYFVFGEVPTTIMLVGAAIVILAGVLIIWRERQLGIERSRQRKAMTP
jgi:drug/metabolite transporter (DMT)-like permease